MIIEVNTLFFLLGFYYFVGILESILENKMKFLALFFLLPFKMLVWLQLQAIFHSSDDHLVSPSVSGGLQNIVYVTQAVPKHPISSQFDQGLSYRFFFFCF